MQTAGLEWERRLWKEGYKRVVGVDEAGRGPLAGPVVAAAVYFPRSLIEEKIPEELEGLTDSKRLTERRRNKFFEVLHKLEGVEIGVGLAEPEIIDRWNIVEATYLAMVRALCQLPEKADYILIDGRSAPKLNVPTQAIVKGDQQSLSIAAASVIAKVTRDRIMLELDEDYPYYGFRRHKGYPTQEHLDALRRFGPTRVHRLSFRSIHRIVEQYGPWPWPMR